MYGREYCQRDQVALIYGFNTKPNGDRTVSITLHSQIAICLVRAKANPDDSNLLLCSGIRSSSGSKLGSIRFSSYKTSCDL